MIEDASIAALRSRELFQHFSDEEFERLSEALVTIEYADGEIIHSADEAVSQESRALLIVLEGVISISTEVEGIESRNILDSIAERFETVMW